MKLALCIGCFLFFAFGISEMHVQKCPVHNFYAEKIYPPIESPLHNNAVGAALAQEKSK